MTEDQKTKCLMVVESSEEEWLKESINSWGNFDIVVLRSPKAAIEMVNSQFFPIIIADMDMQDLGGIQFVRDVKSIDPQMEVIVITESSSLDKAIEAIKMGGYDYLVKPVDVEKLRVPFQEIIENRTKRRQTGELEREIQKTYQFQKMVGRSPMMLEIFSLIQRLSKHFTTVLITGETGTGKEMVARALHNLSPRKGNRFVACNCSALVETLLESELFGHVKGAFTGAIKTKHGLFEIAHGGTIFLDEIGDLSPTLQVKLLRVLQNHEIQRVGSNESIKVDVRVVAATNKDLRRAIEENTFREDLFYRLNVVEVHLPPLRERREDIPMLGRYFLEKFSQKFDKYIKGLSRQVQILFMNYPWEGNIREMENILERACILARGDFITMKDLPPQLVEFASVPRMAAVEDEMSLEEVERLHIQRVLARTHGNKVKAAKILGVSRRSLYRKLEKYHF